VGGILSQLGQLFIQTVPTVIFVFVLYIILRQFFFSPLTAVLKKREEETAGALARAREQAAAGEEKARQYGVAFQAARQEVYRRREVARRSILEDREATLKRAQQQSEALLSEAQASLAAEVAQSKERLQITCQSLGQEIAETILEGAARGGGKGVQP
jgi:F0F1-type ATP synthase membrane subunit b/b'